MIKEFLRKILNKEFESLSTEELELIMNNDNIFSLSKKDKKALEQVLKKGSIKNDKDKVIQTLSEGLPSTVEILSKLDNNSIINGDVEFSFREGMLNNLNKMNNLQLCVFFDKVLRYSKKLCIQFLRNKVYSLHEINGVICRSLGLSLVFEIFTFDRRKRFLAIDYNKIDKSEMINAINNQAVRYLWFLECISEAALTIDEAKCVGKTITGYNKANEIIDELAADYIEVIDSEIEALIEANVRPKQTYIYTLGNLETITVEDDSEDFDLEDFDE